MAPRPTEGRTLNDPSIATLSSYGWLKNGQSTVPTNMADTSPGGDGHSRSRDALRFLAEATAVLNSSLDYQETLTSVVHLVVPRLADWCAVDILDGSTVNRLAVAHVDAAKVALAHELHRRYPPDLNASEGLGYVLGSGRSVLIPALPDAALVAGARDAEHLRLLRSLGLASGMMVPLLIRRQVIGALLFAATDASRTFDATDLSFAEELAGRVAQAIDNARLYLDAQAAKDRLLFLDEAGSLLVASLDYRQTLATLARLTVPRLADYCIIDILDETGAIKRVDVAHKDPAMEHVLIALQERYPVREDGPIATTLEHRKSMLVADASPAQVAALAHDAEHLELLRRLGPRCWIVVPLIARGRTLGTRSLVVSDSRRHYGPEDLRLAEDIARRAALAVDNAALYASAQQAVSDREALLSIASHELKTPLAALMGYARLLLSRAMNGRFSAERDQAGLNVIVEQGERLNRMLDAILDLSRIESGRLRIEQEPVELHTLVQRVVDEIRPTLDLHHLAVSGLEDPVIVIGDELRLEQVLRNLLSNAIKYSPHGGPIVMRMWQQDQQVRIAVRDHGIGIPASEVPRLFQRFFRAPNAEERSISGIGVGLYVVKEIVAQHGGSIDVTSVEGEGSTFVVCLPVAQ